MNDEIGLVYKDLPVEITDMIKETIVNDRDKSELYLADVLSIIKFRGEAKEHNAKVLAHLRKESYLDLTKVMALISIAFSLLIMSGAI